MRFRVKLLGLEAGGEPVVLMNKADAEELGISSHGRIRVSTNGRELTAIVNTTTKLISEGTIVVYEEIRKFLDLREGTEIEVEVAPFPASLYYIRNKLGRRKLSPEETFAIVSDVVEGNLSEMEIASFVVALHSYGLDLDEATSLSLAMVKTGNTLDLGNKLIVDKHSIGGVPGDKTSLLVVPIIASCGLTIPKSSSRAITSAAGTADKAEVLMPVDLDTDEMTAAVQKANGCIVWGGSLHLAPADDIFVKVEHPLSIDPLLLPSIMSKKKAVGANLLVIDIPCGRGTKVKTIGEADLLAKDLIELGRRLNIKVRCAVTYGEQPVGHAIGPALEAREALAVLGGEQVAPDLVDKVVDIAGILLEMSEKGDGKTLALEALRSGRAEHKLREMISAQGGDPHINADDIAIGDQRFTVRSKESGYVHWIDNGSIVEIARLAGAPKDKGAGIVLHKKIGEEVSSDMPLFTVYAEKPIKLQRAEDALGSLDIVSVGDRMEMLIHEVKERPVTRKTFMLER